MTTNTALVTGASSGLGKEAAKLLAARGWRIIAHGRDPERSAAAKAEISAVAQAELDWVNADLSIMADTAKMATDIAALTDRLDLILCNAGGTRAELVITPEGNEATFAGNHLGHFLLVNRLWPLLRATGQSRVISVSSSGHESCPGIDWADLQLIQNWNSGRSYCLAKLCNILFTRELSKRGAADGIAALAMQPGVVLSNFKNHCTPAMKAYMETLEGDTPEQGAKALVWMATAPGIKSNSYFEKANPYEPSAAAQDDEAAALLWAASEKLVASA